MEIAKMTLADLLTHKDQEVKKLAQEIVNKLIEIKKKEEKK